MIEMYSDATTPILVKNGIKYKVITLGSILELKVPKQPFLLILKEGSRGPLQDKWYHQPPKNARKRAANSSPKNLSKRYMLKSKKFHL